MACFIFEASIYLCLAVCCQYVCMCQWAPSERIHQPFTQPIDHTVLPCLLATHRVPAAGCYLSVRTRDFTRLEWGDFHVWCAFESPPPLLLQLPLPASSAGAILGCNIQQQPRCQNALGSDSCLLYPQWKLLFEKGEDLKERNHRDWSVNVI